jgi:cytochrome oxidase Cu insertion factor (SCO1/SenC/PrrC family)
MAKKLTKKDRMNKVFSFQGFIPPSFIEKGVRGLGLLLPLLTILGLLLAACGDNPIPVSQSNSNNTAIKTQPPVKAAVGFTAPDFTARMVNGETIQLSQLRGKAVIINFWATY